MLERVARDGAYASVALDAELAPRLRALFDKYPELKIDLMLEERVLDLPMREADVAIRMKEPSQADLIRKRLMGVRMMLYASPSYVEKNGMPERIEEISGHRLICQNPSSAQVGAGAMLVQELMTHDLRSTLTVSSPLATLAFWCLQLTTVTGLSGIIIYMRLSLSLEEYQVQGQDPDRVGVGPGGGQGG